MILPDLELFRSKGGGSWMRRTEQLQERRLGGDPVVAREQFGVDGDQDLDHRVAASRRIFRRLRRNVDDGW